MVPWRRLELPRPCGHRYLKPARLPIPPPGHRDADCPQTAPKVNEQLAQVSGSRPLGRGWRQDPIRSVAGSRFREISGPAIGVNIDDAPYSDNFRRLGFGRPAEQLLEEPHRLCRRLPQCGQFLLGLRTQRGVSGDGGRTRVTGGDQRLHLLGLLHRGSDQFAHGAALMVLTPSGRVSRYLYGFEYNPRDVRLALVEASANKIGNATDAILLLCYHYDPVTGKYSRGAMTVQW